LIESARFGRILVVEDEELVRALLVSYLEEFGFEADVAASAAEAKATLAQLEGALDAVLLDVGLPDARGDALLGELRAHYPSLAVVISSGYDRPALASVELPGIEILRKPFSQVQLLSALERLIDWSNQSLNSN
jgi:DNA-binding response OmpR family regulator